jgi:AbrB family looped-hinge helix DNA binding protein
LALSNSIERGQAVWQRVKVSKKHQIAVPAKVREELGISAGDHLLVDVQDGVIVLVPEPTDPIEQMKGLGREIWEGIDAQEYVNRERNEW